MMKQIAVVALLALAVASVYGKDSTPDLQKKIAGRAGKFPCMGFARYMVTVSFDWSGSTHPEAYPDGGFFSPQVTASHGKYFTMWAPLGFASEGMQTVVETGNPTMLMEELSEQMRRNVLQIRSQSRPTSSGTQMITARVRMSGARSYISSAAMLAPSPDWFTGIQKENMCNTETGEWYDMKSGNLSVWDAGTDAGEDFLSEDAPIAPAQRMPIISILSTRFGGMPVGTYEIVRI